MLPRIAIPAQPRQVITERVPFPEHQCFCCKNRGYVFFGWLEELAALPENQGRNIQPDLPRICLRRDCNGVWNDSLQKFQSLSSEVMQRSLNDLTPDACEAIHQEGKRRWREDCRAWAENQRNQQKAADDIRRLISTSFNVP
jgi:hypothetical protein